MEERIIIIGFSQSKLTILKSKKSSLTESPLTRGKTEGQGDSQKPNRIPHTKHTTIYYIYFMYYLPYNMNLKQFSRNLRNNSTLGEVLLWQELRAGQIKGYKFNRQKPLDQYIVDFYCKRLNLVIEVDGSSHYHEEGLLQDQARQEILEAMELSFLRFDDLDVKQNMIFVLQTIYDFVERWQLENNI
jgi:very-short-patch-repair endonuclease